MGCAADKSGCPSGACAVPTVLSLKLEGFHLPFSLWLGAKEVVLGGAQEALSYDSVGHCGERCSGEWKHSITRENCS